MAESPIIGGGVSRTGYGNERNDFYDFRQTNRSKFSTVQFKTGEIMQGTVLEAAEKEVLVRFPMGSVRASLTGKLRNGDVLYFKVISTEPQLVLKIHSVPVQSQRKEMKEEELIRILNLPDSKLSREILKLFLRTKSMILQDDAWSLYKSVLKLEDDQLRSVPLIQTVQTVAFLLDASIEINDQYFKKMKHAFKSLSNFSQIFIELKELARNPEADALKTLIARIEQLSPSQLINMFIIPFKSDQLENSFYKLFFDLSLFFKNSPSCTRISDLLGELAMTCEALFYQNIIAVATNNAKLFLLPYRQGRKLRFASILCSGKSYTDIAQRFSVIVETDNLGTVVSQGSVAGRTIDAALFSDSEEVVEFLRSRIEELRNYFKNFSLQSNSVFIGQSSALDFERLKELATTRPAGISFVV